MHSLKSKITLLSVISISVIVLVTTIIATVAVRRVGNESANRILSLLCETGEKNLDMCFSSIEQSAKTISKYAEDDLKSTSLEDLHKHIERVKDVFEKTAEHTAGVLTYYYRIDPYLEQTSEKGFWFVMKADDKHFYEHAVTDISGYDPDDTTSFVWFTVPKKEGRSIWLSPYFTDTLGACVFSYNVPIYKDKQFIGVVGIEVDYNTIANTVKTISLYSSGYAFINDKNGRIICHPDYTYEELAKNHPDVPDGLISSNKYLTYKFNGEVKQAVWIELNNGMRLNVTVPVSEINSSWQNTMVMIIIVAAVLMLVAVTLEVILADHIAKPLKKLSEAAEQVDAGNYNVNLKYKGRDEVATLTRTFNDLVSDLRVYINDLNSIAYKDALTSVHNKSAYDKFVATLQERINRKENDLQFAIAVFDCDDLKHINDKFGHDKGDIYLKKASEVICHAFKHSPVFRTGGDEFTVVIENADYEALEKNESDFREMSIKTHLPDANEWDTVKVAIGISKFNPGRDSTVIDVVRRADKIMYDDKRHRKVGRKFYEEA